MFYSKSSDNQFFYRYNSTEYDYAVVKMMEASTYMEARSWAWNCCEILLRDMPMVPVYVEGVAHAYRTDLWEGYVPMSGLHVFGGNPWTCRKLHLKDTAGGPFGAYYPVTYRQVLSEGIDYTNVLLSGSGYTDEVMNKIYSRLWQLDPYTWEKIPDLAYHWTREDTVASGDIQAGERYTFTLYENVTWHDGTPFTAEDVKFSYEKLWPQSTYRWDVCTNIYRIDVPNNYTVEIYTNRPGFFEFTQSTYHYILPKHIWAPYEAINFTWTPVTPADMTGTGPFHWVTRTIGQSILLARNPTYHLRLDIPTRPPAPNLPLTMQIILISLGLLIIISQVILIAYLFRRRKHQTK
jgi:ABC-type transport system substrate-binding protein